jgi:glycosyltransferase involved in cell wall biosynthesis
MAVLISGIGRSGTTTVYQILGKGFISKYGQAKCSYEPYLWEIPAVESTAVVKGQPFSVNQVGLFNVNVHCHTPIFLEGRNSLHDHWLRKVFGPMPPSATKAPDNSMAKVIRGAGRLEAALTKYENLKVVIITRNIIDTANSGLGLFSFFGDEFHPSDKTRFVKEVNEKFAVNIDVKSLKSELDWSILWWHYLTEASIQTYEKFPDRVKLVPYEHYNKNKRQVMGEIFDFADIEQIHIDESLFEQGAGPTTSISYLTNTDINLMRQEVEWYFTRLKEAISYETNFDEFNRLQAQKYYKRQYFKSLLLTKPTDLTAVQWRIQQKNEQLTPRIEKQKQRALKYFTVSAATAECGGNINALINARKSSVTGKMNKSTGVLITCHNNEDTIGEAILSVLSQTQQVDLICVADDCSTDNSVEIINSLVEKYSAVELIQRPMNVGVSANRDLAIRSMGVDYIATLDGDDLYYPEKIELELNAILANNSAVSFSDIVIITKENSFVQDTSSYSGTTVHDMLEMLTSRSCPVPRDMLFSKDLFIHASGFDVGLSIYEDWAFKMRLIVASSGGWVHSGGKGTIYDRRSPGLSGKPKIEHAYGQLLAIARNAELLKSSPVSILAGLNTVKRQLEGNMLKRFDSYIMHMKQTHLFEQLIDDLNQFWLEASFKDAKDYKYQHIWKFSNVKS